MLQREQLMRGKEHYHIYSNKRRGAHVIFPATNVALSRGRRLFKHCTRKIYFFYIFIQRYTFYLLIFLWTDTKLIVNLELREKFTRWKKPESFMKSELRIARILERELTARAEKYGHFELKNITFKENKLPMLF